EIIRSVDDCFRGLPRLPSPNRQNELVGGLQLHHAGEPGVEVFLGEIAIPCEIEIGCVLGVLVIRPVEQISLRRHDCSPYSLPYILPSHTINSSLRDILHVGTSALEAPGGGKGAEVRMDVTVLIDEPIPLLSRPPPRRIPPIRPIPQLLIRKKLLQRRILRVIGESVTDGPFLSVL